MFRFLGSFALSSEPGVPSAAVCERSLAGIDTAPFNGLLDMARKNDKNPSTTSKDLSDAERTAPGLRPTVEYRLSSDSSNEDGAETMDHSEATFPSTPKATFNGMPSLVEPIPAKVEPPREAQPAAKTRSEVLPEIDDEAKTIVQAPPRRASGLPSPGETLYPRPQDPEIRSERQMEPAVPPAQSPGVTSSPTESEVGGIPQAVHEDKSTMYVVSELVSSLGGDPAPASTPSAAPLTGETRVESITPERPRKNIVQAKAKANPNRMAPAAGLFGPKFRRIALITGGMLLFALTIYGMGRRHGAEQAREYLAQSAEGGDQRGEAAARPALDKRPDSAKRPPKGRVAEAAVAQADVAPQDPTALPDKVERPQANSPAGSQRAEPADEYPQLLDEDENPAAEASPSAEAAAGASPDPQIQDPNSAPAAQDPGTTQAPGQVPSQVPGQVPGQAPSTPVTPSKALPSKRKGERPSNSARPRRPQSTKNQAKSSPRQLLAQSRRTKGQKAYRLAAASYSKQKSWGALERMATAACEMNNLTLAREALRRLSVGERRRKVRRYCRSIGIRLGVVM